MAIDTQKCHSESFSALFLPATLLSCIVPGEPYFNQQMAVLTQTFLSDRVASCMVEKEDLTTVKRGSDHRG